MPKKWLVSDALRNKIHMNKDMLVLSKVAIKIDECHI